MQLEIYMKDLVQSAQLEVCKAMGIVSAEEANLDVFPLFTLEIDSGTDDASCGGENG